MYFLYPLPFCLFSLSLFSSLSLSLSLFVSPFLSYARPLFLRINKEVRVIEEGSGLTGTFKHKKVAFRDQGYDVASIEAAGELAFFRDDENKTFVAMDVAMEKELNSGAIRV